MTRTKKTKPGGMVRGFLRPLRRYLITGLLVWVPLIITIWVSWLVVSKVGFGLERIFSNLFKAAREFCERVPALRSIVPALKYHRGMGFFMAIALFLATGILTRNLIGRKIIAAGERILDRIPFISRVYRAVQQIRDVFVCRDGTVFQYVCLVEYPRPGMMAIAFVTSAEQGVVQETAEKKLVAVFIPTTPNPTSGYLVYLPPEDITLLDITVEEAMKLIVSGGAYLPGTSTEGGPGASLANDG